MLLLQYYMAIVVASCCLVSTTTAWTYDALMRQSKMMHKTRRDPIQMPTNTPMVPYKPDGADYAQFVDLNTRFIQNRVLMISTYIDEEAANQIISTLLYLRKESMNRPIDIYINCPGAQLRPGLAVYDLISSCRDSMKIRTVNLGLCAGIGAMLVGAGTKGVRCAMPNARFLLQHTGMETVFRGQASDIGLEVKSMMKSNIRLDEELHKLTGQSIEKVNKDMSRDFYLFADEAVQYGLTDQILLPTYKKATIKQVADLGNFQGKEQRYQGQENKGGFGSQQDLQRQREEEDNDDDDGPKIFKG